jgi:hypothetical protein
MSATRTASWKRWWSAGLGRLVASPMRLKTVVIGALYPRLMSTAEVLSLLRPQRSPESFGPYAVLLSHLSTRIPAADIPAALSWAAGRVQDGEDAFGDLLPQLVRRGWESVTSPGTREPLAQLTAGLGAGHSWPYWPRQDDLP